MAQGGQAPRFLGWTSKRGVPVFAIILTNLFGALAMMNVSTGAAKAYGYIVNISGVSTFLVWGSISFIHIRFRTAWKKQGRSPSELPYQSMLYPWNAYFGLAANVFLAFVQGWSTLSPFNAGNFVSAYILLPLFPIIFVLFKLVNKTHFRRSHEIDLDYGRREDLDIPSPKIALDGSKLPWWRRMLTSF